MKVYRAGLLIVLLIFTRLLTAQTSSRDSLGIPLRIPLRLSANFGELRPNHFHSGIDLKTQGKTGLPVVSAGTGYIGRISVSTGGFGKALYLHHPNGLTTVYAHLKSFTPEIEALVKREQYRRQQFSVAVFPAREAFPVEQGDTIALSGNTGSSAGPHLHYEIRRTDGQVPQNPLQYPYDIPDNMKPVLRSFWMYTRESENQPMERIRIPVRKQGNAFRPVALEVLRPFRQLAFGVEAFDYLDNSWNKCGVYEIMVSLDNELVYHFKMDGFRFNQTRYINAHIDYPGWRETGKKIHRTWVLPNNRLQNYVYLKNKGIITLEDTLQHTVSIVLKDVAGNKIRIESPLRRLQETHIAPNGHHPRNNGLFRLAWESDNTFSSEGLELYIPEKALYENTTLHHERADSLGTDNTLGGVYVLDIPAAPFHVPAQLRLDLPDSLPVPRESLCLASLRRRANLSYAGAGTLKENRLQAEIRGDGIYTLSWDTLAPEILPLNFREGSRMSHKYNLRLKMTDDFSGIGEYTGYINGKWSLFVYDPKSERLVYKFDPERLERNKHHSLTIIATDNKGNRKEFKSSFYW